MDEELKELPPVTPAGRPRDVTEARRAVEDTRQRISSTLDQLEARIVDKKEELRDRVDVVRPVREYVGARPLVAIAAAAGVGLLLGLLSGGSDTRVLHDSELSGSDQDVVSKWRRERRKRLLDTAEDELPSFEPPPSRVGRFFRDMTHEVAGAATALLVAQLVDRVRDERDR